MAKNVYGNCENMKVALLCQWDQPKDSIGGADVHVRNLVNHLSTIDGIELHVISMKRGLKENELFEKDNVLFHILACPNISKSIASLFSATASGLDITSISAELMPSTRIFSLKAPSSSPEKPLSYSEIITLAALNKGSS